jgi:hypothetical protein
VGEAGVIGTRMASSQAGWRIRRSRWTSAVSSSRHDGFFVGLGCDWAWTGSRRITSLVTNFAGRMWTTASGPMIKPGRRRYGRLWREGHWKVVASAKDDAGPDRWHWTRVGFRGLLGYREAAFRHRPRSATGYSESSSEGGLQALRLVDVLRRLPPRELGSADRPVAHSVDEAKRVTRIAVARSGWLPELRDPGPFLAPRASSSIESPRRAVSAGRSLPPAVEPWWLAASCSLVAGGRSADLAIAFIVVLRAWKAATRAERADRAGQPRRRGHRGALSGPARHAPARAFAGAGVGDVQRPARLEEVAALAPLERSCCERWKKWAAKSRPRPSRPRARADGCEATSATRHAAASLRSNGVGF